MKKQIGQKYGKLTIIDIYYEKKELKNIEYKNHNQYYTYYKCLCDCGNIKVTKYIGTKNSIDNCGCEHKNKIPLTKERKIELKLREVFSNMKTRCYNSNSKSYKDYGGRGITICDEWLNSFHSFKEWAINNGYKQGLSIERKNVNGNYEPNNCTFTNNIVQSNNRTNNHFITWNNKTQTIADWERELGYCYNSLRNRINKGWTVEKAMSIPIKQKKLRGRP